MVVLLSSKKHTGVPKREKQTKSTNFRKAVNLEAAIFPSSLCNEFFVIHSDGKAFPNVLFLMHWNC